MVHQKPNILGFIESQGNTHQGQGTKNRKFIFENLFLELIWLHHPHEAQSPTTQPTQLYERMTQSACPFGVGFRIKKQVYFPYWTYQPQYLPKPLCIYVAQNNLLTEPVWFGADFLSKPSNPKNKQNIEHIKITIPHFKAHPNALSIQQSTNFSIVDGDEYLLKIKTNGQPHDCRPILPIIFY